MSIDRTHARNHTLSQVGDICDLYNPLTGAVTGDSFNITRMTRTQVIITRNGHEVRYRKDTGRPVGMTWMDPWLLRRHDQTRD